MRFASPAELVLAAARDGGTDLGASGWVDVGQQRITAFADATGDHQWIHVDPRRAAAGPFGTTIAHGHLTLSLLPVMTGQLLVVDGAALVVNYGFDRVRFLAAVPAGARLRARAVLTAATTTDRGVRTTTAVTVEVAPPGGRRGPATADGAAPDGPGPTVALVADSLALYVPA